MYQLNFIRTLLWPCISICTRTKEFLSVFEQLYLFYFIVMLIKLAFEPPDTVRILNQSKKQSSLASSCSTMGC